MDHCATQGLIHTPSRHSCTTTTERLELLITEKKMAVIANVDHAASAAKINETLRPTTLLLFGNPQAGTPLMQNSQTAAIDLPQKYLVWEDQQGQTWITHNDPAYIAARHNTEGLDTLLGNVTTALQSIATAAGE